MKNLRSNIAFGHTIESKLILGEIDYKEYFILRSTFDSFLIQNLELWMFVPCKLVDGVWVRLSEPKEYKNWLEIQKHGGYSMCHNSNEYQKALDRILFKGIEFADVQPSTEYNYYHLCGNKIFEANNQYKFFPCYGLRTIEDLVQYSPQLTATALKQIGL